MPNTVRDCTESYLRLFCFSLNFNLAPLSGGAAAEMDHQPPRALWDYQQHARDVICSYRHLGFAFRRKEEREIVSFDVDLRCIYEKKHNRMPKEDKRECFRILGIENGSSECMFCLYVWNRVQLPSELVMLVMKRFSYSMLIFAVVSIRPIHAGYHLNEICLLCFCLNLPDEIKKAYKRLALQCHPDKVQYLVVRTQFIICYSIKTLKRTGSVVELYDKNR